MKQTIAFRVDSGQKIGMGHVMRCVTLATRLKELGVASLFICRPATGSIEDKIVSAGFELKSLPPIELITNPPIGLMHGDFLPCSQIEDAQATLKALAERPDIKTIIVDHYGVFKPWDEIISKFHKIYKIDDLADRDHECYGLLDQNFYLDMNSRYSDLMPQSARFIVGPKYALLRSIFQDLDISSRQSRQNIKHALISFGGVDSFGYSLKVSKDILLQTNLSVTVMGQPRNSDIDEWQALKSFYGDRLNGPSYLSDPIEAMMRADIYIGAGGTTTWERFACGLPGIVYSIAENQIKMAQDLAAAGFQQYAGPIAQYQWENLSQHLHKANNKDKLWFLAQKMRAEVDGRGADRVIKAWDILG